MDVNQDPSPVSFPGTSSLIGRTQEKEEEDDDIDGKSGERLRHLWRVFDGDADNGFTNWSGVSAENSMRFRCKTGPAHFVYGAYRQKMLPDSAVKLHVWSVVVCSSTTDHRGRDTARERKVCFIPVASRRVSTSNTGQTFRWCPRARGALARTNPSAILNATVVPAGGMWASSLPPRDAERDLEPLETVIGPTATFRGKIYIAGIMD
nr:hypothetical protein CFP56_30783 [Quercus suber]